MSDWVIIGVPTSAGAHHAGQERAPSALREAGLLDQMRAAGAALADTGDLPGAVFAVDREHPGSRNLSPVARVAGEVADAVAGAIGRGPLPLVIGGDCTITLGVIAGFRRSYPRVGLVYVDGDADLGVPDSGDRDSGVFDAMGIRHMLGGGAPELSGLGGTPPLLEPSRLAMVGCDPREIDDGGRRFLADLGVSFQDGPALRADPVGTAARALAAIESSADPIVVHFDVDVIDSGDLPLANFPHYGSGVRLEDAVACVHALRRHPAFAGIVLTEVNPTYDADGSVLRRYVDGVAAAIAP
jgi:arginase